MKELLIKEIQEFLISEGFLKEYETREAKTPQGPLFIVETWNFPPEKRYSEDDWIIMKHEHLEIIFLKNARSTYGERFYFTLQGFMDWWKTLNEQ